MNPARDLRILLLPLFLVVSISEAFAVENLGADKQSARGGHTLESTSSPLPLTTRNLSLLRDQSATSLNPSLVWGVGLLSEEPNEEAGVQSPSWLIFTSAHGDDTEKAVESVSRRGSYLKYVLPVAITLAAGTTTYLLYTTRSR